MVKKMVPIRADPLRLGRSLVFARTVVTATVSLFGRWLEPLQCSLPMWRPEVHVPEVHPDACTWVYVPGCKLT
jgi:hypothetical protein